MVTKSEAEFSEKIVGPTILKSIEHFKHGDSLFSVMEYCSNDTLESLMKKNGESKPFSDSQIMLTLAQIVVALLSLHSKNILHREITMSNIFVTENGICKLGNMGNANN